MLTERQRDILATIVQEYADTGKAVGSKALLANSRLEVSSATIRNEMAVLENVGLLRKEHTSSGRVPSQAGYRYYVDELMDREVRSPRATQALNRIFSRNFQQVDDLLQQSVDALADMSGYTTVALKPEAMGTRLSGFRLVPLDGSQIMALVVTNDGEVTSQTFRLPDGMQVDDLDNMVQYINETLVNHPVLNVLATLQGDLPMKMERLIQTPAAFLQLFGDVLARSIQEEVFVGGKLNLLDFSQGADHIELKQLFQLLEAPNVMRQNVGLTNLDTQVQIGRENQEGLLNDYTVVSAAYHIPRHGAGAIAIIGPTGMAYDEIVGTVAQFRDAISDELIDYY